MLKKAIELYWKIYSMWELSWESVGVKKSSIVLTARSGRAALNFRLNKIGYKVTKEKLNGLYDQFLQMADERKEINDQDLRELVANFKAKLKVA